MIFQVGKSVYLRVSVSQRRTLKILQFLLTATFIYTDLTSRAFNVNLYYKVA